MTVYVDTMKLPYGRMLMSHMTADTLDELHEMARKLGLRRDWFQDGRHPHYDVSQSKRQLALNLGAVEVSPFQLVKAARSIVPGEPHVL